MSEFDPLKGFGRLITQVKHSEYERGWRDAMDAIQRAVITMYRRSNDSDPLGDESDGEREPDEVDEPAEPEVDIVPLEQSPPEPEERSDSTDDDEASRARSADHPRFVTPKWAMLRR